MAVMLRKTYEALRAANVSEELASAAAEELAGFQRLEVEIEKLRTEVSVLRTEMRAGFRFLYLMTGTVGLGILFLIWRTFV